MVLTVAAVTLSLGLGVVLAAVSPSPLEVAVVTVGLILAIGWVGLLVSRRTVAMAVQVLVFVCPVLYALLVPDIYIVGGRRSALVGYTVAVQAMLGLAILRVATMTRMYRARPFAVSLRLQTLGMSVLVTLVCLGLTVGAIHRNSLNYLVGDVVKPLAYVSFFLVFVGLTKVDLVRLFHVYYGGLFASQLVTLAAWLLLRPPRLESTSWHNNLALFIGSFALALFSGRIRLFLAGCLGMVLSVFVGSQMAYRTLILMYPLSAAVLVTSAAVLGPRQTRTAVIRRCIVVCTVMACCSATCLVVVPDLLDLLVRRFSSLDPRLDDMSLRGRIAEAEVIFWNLRRGGVLSWLLGYGLGAQYELPSFYTSEMGSKAVDVYLSTDYRVHNIHIFYVALLFRTGLVGIALWIVFHGIALLALAQSLARTLRGHVEDAVFLCSWAFVYVVAASIAALMFSMLDRDVNFAVLALVPLLNRDGNSGRLGDSSRGSDGPGLRRQGVLCGRMRSRPP